MISFPETQCWDRCNHWHIDQLLRYYSYLFRYLSLVTKQELPEAGPMSKEILEAIG